MKKRKKMIGSISVLGVMLSCFFQACMHPSPVPPSNFVSIKTFYKTKDGVDLLDWQNANAFKYEDIVVTSKLAPNGNVSEADFNRGTGNIAPSYDVDAQSYYVSLAIPTNFGITPIETLVRLNSTITDTVTYTFGKSKYAYMPDKIYYNRKLVWDIVNASGNGPWPPITIIK